jgi:uncharacterized protein UPF0004
MATRTQEVRTFGCKINVHDSERIAGLLDEAGYGPVADSAQPDVVAFSPWGHVAFSAETGVDGRTEGFRARGSW